MFLHTTQTYDWLEICDFNASHEYIELKYLFIHDICNNISMDCGFHGLILDFAFSNTLIGEVSSGLCVVIFRTNAQGWPRREKLTFVIFFTFHRIITLQRREDQHVFDQLMFACN